jgi:hypothetical protein
MAGLHRIERNLRVRQYQRDQAGAGRIEVTFQIPLEGTAKSGIAIAATELLWFGLAFYPQPGEKGNIDPAFRSGFSIKPRGSQYDARVPLGFMGFANCPYFKYNDDGFAIGAICHIGIANLSADASDIPFEGYVNLSFLGMAMRSPYDSGNEHVYTGPKSVASMQRYQEDDD